MSRERCQGDMGDSDYTERAFRAYFRAGANIQPSASSSGLRSHEGRDYVVLENCNGILAEYKRSASERWNGAARTPDRPGDASGAVGGPYTGALAPAVDPAVNPGRDRSPLTRF